MIYPTPTEIKEYKKQERLIKSRTDWLVVFPEALLILSDIAQEKLSLVEKIGNEYKHKLNWLYKQDCSDFDRFFFETIYKARFTPQIQSLYQDIFSLKREFDKHNAKYKTENHSENHISDQDIEKARLIPIADLFTQDGFDLKKHGFNFASLCPFHDEKTPSCTLYINDNRYYCFGCNATGDSIQYIMRTKNINFVEAIKYLK